MSTLKAGLMGLMLAIAAVSAVPWVIAHEGATRVTKERMDLMKGMADSMKIMGAMFKGEAVFDPAVIAEQAGFLAEHASQIPTTTPEGSYQHPSEALPVIWQAWDDYVADANALKDESTKLEAIANNGADQTSARDQFAKLSKTCGACHDRFRKPKG